MRHEPGDSSRWVVMAAMALATGVLVAEFVPEVTPMQERSNIAMLPHRAVKAGGHAWRGDMVALPRVPDGVPSVSARLSLARPSLEVSRASSTTSRAALTFSRPAFSEILFAAEGSPVHVPRLAYHHYFDPVAGGVVPLVRVRGREDVRLSENFRLGDFAAKDGAPYVRVSYRLVDALERLQERLGARVYVNSAYRHPRHNFSRAVEGAEESRHMAGMAADVWVEDRSPLEVAEAALEVMDCRLGIGLGAGFVHIDVREQLGSWVREGAEMDEPDFDIWVLERCGMTPDSLLLFASLEVPALEVVRGPEAVQPYRAEMAALARVHWRRQERGAVLLDLRTGVPGPGRDLDYRLTFVRPDHPVAAALSVDPIIAFAESSGNFVYILVAPDGAQEVGIMTLNPQE